MIIKQKENDDMENKILNCKQCGEPTENIVELVTVKTMVDRGWKKDKFYQAMGDIIETAVCDKCLDKYIDEVLNPKKRILKLSLLTAIVVAGCLVLFFFVPLTAFRVFCVVLAGIAVLALLQEIGRIRKRTKVAMNRNEQDRRKALAVNLVSELLPKRHVDADLTYIDIRRVMRDNLELLGKEYGVSYKKLEAIRSFLREEKKKHNLEEEENK